MFRLAAKIPSVVGLRLSNSAWFQRLAEGQYDRRFGVRTSGMVPAAELDMPEEQRRFAVEYAPTTGAKFGCLLSQLPLCYQKYVFVDFGCGKGRTLLMASDFPFHAIVGVELSTSLHSAAEENIACYRSRYQQCVDLQAKHANATAFEFPEQPLVLYFFNPFSDEILRQVLDNVTRSLEACPRDVVIIYYNPEHQDLIADLRFFTRCEVKGWNEPEWAVFRTDIKIERGSPDGEDSPGAMAAASAD